MVLYRALPEGREIGPTEEDVTTTNSIPRHTFLNVWDLGPTVHKIDLEQSNLEYLWLDNILYLSCRICEVFKEATTASFTADLVNQD